MDLLSQAREIINAVDEEMAKLFVRRMQAAQMVAEYKKENGMPILDPVREEQVVQKNANRIADEEMRSYYIPFIRRNMEISRSYQEKLLTGMRVAYCGTEGAFAHIATKRLFPSANAVPFGTFTDAYRAVEAGDCEVAVLPVENSYNGEVGQVTDLMFSGSLYLNGIYDLAVSHDLLAVAGATKEDIKQVISHPQALGQCAEYIRENGWEQMEYPNTALAAKYVAQTNDKTVAAIASEAAAEIFGLEVLERNINESRSNTTRFAVLARSENTKLSEQMGAHFVLMFTVQNQAGSLAKAINVIGSHGFNMRTLRSRPMKELLWQYYFYVEAEGDIHSPEGVAMLRQLSVVCDRLKAVGSYCKSDI